VQLKKYLCHPSNPSLKNKREEFNFLAIDNYLEKIDLASYSSQDIFERIAV